MTQNLRIINKTITSDDSEISFSSYKIPSNSSYTNFCNNDLVHQDSTYGVYYSWNVAVAGTLPGSIPAGTDAPNSICAKGFRLPSAKDFETLVEFYNNNTDARNRPINAIYSGRIGCGPSDRTSLWGRRTQWVSRTRGTSNQNAPTSLVITDLSWRTENDCTAGMCGYAVRCVSSEK